MFLSNRFIIQKKRLKMLVKTILPPKRNVIVIVKAAKTGRGVDTFRPPPRKERLTSNISPQWPFVVNDHREGNVLGAVHFLISCGKWEEIQ